MTPASTLRSFAGLLAALGLRRLGVIAAVLLAIGAIEGVGLVLLLPLLQIVGVDTGAGAGTAIISGVTWLFARVRLQPTLAGVLGLYVAITWLQSSLQRWQSRLGADVEQEITATVRTRLYAAIGCARWSFLSRRRLSDFTHVLTHEADRVGVAAWYLLDIVLAAVIAFAYFALALKLSAAMTMAVVVVGASLAWLLRGRMREAHRSGQALSAASAELHSTISEHLSSLKTARSYGAEARHHAIFARLTRTLRSVRIESAEDFGRLRHQMTLGSTVALAAIVYVSHGVLALPPADVLVLLFVFGRLMPRVTAIYQRAQALETQLPAFTKVLETERQCLAAAEEARADSTVGQLHNQLSVANVTHAYDEAQSPALHQVSVDIPAGSTVAIVGPSGAGKSTLADVVMGLLTPSSGAVLVDGRPLTSENVAGWRAQIGYVAQDTFLFHDTVRANLLWARPDATDADLARALHQASASQFVAALPNGLDTIVGDRGVLLSGGERQRLSLARALLRGPRVLILDEATSALDSENEARIQHAIQQLHHEMTIVIITHRLSAVRGADMIYVLDGGSVVERGTWEQLLLRRSGRFTELCRAQGIDTKPPLEVVAR